MNQTVKAPNGASKDKPWIFRTYAGHSTAEESNRLYRANLARGQTGLSVAFDLPTQTGYDSDHILARGEVGKVGVPISHIGDMRVLLDQIPLDRIVPNPHQPRLRVGRSPPAPCSLRRRGRRSMRERTSPNTSGTFWISSRMTGVFTSSRKPCGSARSRATRSGSSSRK